MLDDKQEKSKKEKETTNEKNLIVKTDLKDKKILFELDRNARQSNSELARKVSLNKNTLGYKIKRMEEEGVILGYYVVVDPSKLGFISFRIYFNFFNSSAEKEKEIINWLIKRKEVGVVVGVESPYDVAIHVLTKSIKEFDDFWLEFKKEFREHVWKERVYLASRVYHFKRKYLLNSRSCEHDMIFCSEKENFDELDFKILKMLAKNARTSILDIAEKLKTPERTIAFRIKQLEKKKIIQSYRANINVARLGYDYYKLNCILNDMKNFDKLFQFSQEQPNVVYINRTISELDLELDIEIKGRQEMLKFIQELKERFSVRDIEIASYKEYYKLELIPEEI
jgi:Lrp/AsnC family transcriptional regulator, leucine-responsive regulatory protein